HHAAGLFAYGSDPVFTRFIGARPFTKLSQADFFIHVLTTDNATGRRVYWVVERRTDGQAIGTMGFNLLFPIAQRLFDFGYGIAPAHWGDGTFGEAARAVLAHGFTELGAERIQVMTRADNTRSVAAVERLGFLREGLLRQWYAVDGGRADCVILGMLPGELRG
ncbi:MAG: GNAT family N-acetyltransferase, partial [Alphaproteobacteria bacterium]